MFVLAVIIVNTMGQSFVDERLELLKGLPPDQFEAARQIILLGGDVWPPDGKVVKPFAESITFRGEKFTDAEIPLLTPFRGTPLNGIGFVGARLTEAGIAHALAEFPELRFVTVVQMPVGDAGLAPLAQFHNLESLGLDETKVTSAILQRMARQPRLEYLTLQATAIDDVGMRCLEGLPVLKSLALGKTRITSTGLSSIGKLLNLESLTINGTRIDDAGLKHLEPLRKLHRNAA
jgi:Leucine-rich repeat (LRR) protein